MHDRYNDTIISSVVINVWQPSLRLLTKYCGGNAEDAKRMYALFVQSDIGSSTPPELVRKVYVQIYSGKLDIRDDTALERVQLDLCEFCADWFNGIAPSLSNPLLERKWQAVIRRERAHTSLDAGDLLEFIDVDTQRSWWYRVTAESFVAISDADTCVDQGAW